MDIQEYFNKIKTIQNDVCEFICDENSNELNYESLIKLFVDLKVPENQHDIKIVLNLISTISNNYHRNSSFLTKIFRILTFFKEQIKKNFSNFEIFNIFKKNKRIILFLIEENIIFIDNSIANVMMSIEYSSYKFHYYFFPEIKDFLDAKTIADIKNKLSDVDFDKNRKIGENHSEITRIIRNDLIDDFIVFVNQTNIPLNYKIKSSIFETNLFLLKRQTSLIEYAAFFGSIRIFKYLSLKGVDLKPSLCFYTIHSGNAELFSLLEENKIIANEKDYEHCLEESIKCHQIELSDYIIGNLNSKNKILERLNILSLKYYSFSYTEIKFINKLLFFDLCEFDYFYIVELLLNAKDIDINSIFINKFLFLIVF